MRVIPTVRWYVLLLCVTLVLWLFYKVACHLWMVWRVNIHCSSYYAEYDAFVHLMTRRHMSHERLTGIDPFERSVDLALLSCTFIMDIYSRKLRLTSGLKHATQLPACQLVSAQDACHVYALTLASGESCHVWAFCGLVDVVSGVRLLLGDGLQQAHVSVSVDGTESTIGVNNWWWTMARQLFERDSDVLLRDPQKPVIVTGFSRGGTFAEYCALMLRAAGHADVTVCSIGKAMSGNREFCSLMDECFAMPSESSTRNCNLRVQMRGDPICTLPWNSLFEPGGVWYQTQADGALMLESEAHDYAWQPHLMHAYFLVLYKIATGAGRLESATFGLTQKKWRKHSKVTGL